MKILLAPAETKVEGGSGQPFCSESFIFPELFSKRLEMVTLYEEHLETHTIDELKKWFGIKKDSEVIKYKESVMKKPTMKAIQRYDGVAFGYLDYQGLNPQEQKYIDENVLLFSNLFGPLRACDMIPDYKFKQGAKLENIPLEKYYKEHFQIVLDEYLKEEDIVDLRAGFYDKFYIPTKKYLTMKFIKEGKVVSHWAKAYRGMVVKEMAKHKIQTIKELMDMPIEGLRIQEIIERGDIKTLVMEIEN